MGRVVLIRRLMLIGIVFGGFVFWPIVFLFIHDWRESLAEMVGTAIVLVLYLFGLAVYRFVKRCPACPHKLDDHEGFLFGDHKCIQYACGCPGVAAAPVVPKAKVR